MTEINRCEFYNVHCTSCGKVVAANTMAVDIDKIFRMHLSKHVRKNNRELMFKAGEIFEEIRVGMYLSKRQMSKDGILDSDGTLHFTAQYILRFIERKYGVNFADVQYLDEDFLDDIDSFGKLDEKEEDKYEIPEELLDNLCINMKLYVQQDSAEDEKRKTIKKMICFLLEYKNEELLRCNCNFKFVKDDKGIEFIDSVEVRYLNGDIVNYSHMVCPECGESFFIDAGKYEEKIIVMLGSARVGKTAYLAAVVNEVISEFGKKNYSMFTINDTVDSKYTYFKNNILELYRNGKKITKTDESKENVALFSMEMTVKDRVVILTFVDLPGEVFEPRSDEELKSGEANMEYILNKRAICSRAHMFWFCISPKQIDRRLLKMNETANKSDKVDTDMEKLFGNISNTLKVIGDTEKLKPTAIILTMSDLIEEEMNLYYKDRSLEPQCLKDGSFLSDRLRSVSANVVRYLTSSNIQNIFARLNNMFLNKNFFTVASYGAEIDEKTGNCNLAPSGIILPFVWSLSVLGYLPNVEYRHEIERKGIFRTREVTNNYYEIAPKSNLFYHS